MAAQLGNTSPPVVVLRPGDQVLVALAEDLPAEEARQFTTELRRSFPTVSFTVVGGIAGLAVMAGGDPGTQPQEGGPGGD